MPGAVPGQRCRGGLDAPIFCKWFGWGAGCWSGVLGEAAEAGRPVALSTRGFGLPGGDVGCPGEDLGEHVQQLCPFGGGEGGQDGLHGAANIGLDLGRLAGGS